MNDATYKKLYQDSTAETHRRKANQCWDMAGLARQDRDTQDAERQTARARWHEEMARN